MHYLLQGDVVERLAALPENTFHGLLSDPPYGLEFMGKDWDRVVPGVDTWRAVLRVLRPGAYCLVFGGTRTFHRLAVAMEDAGFEIRDVLSWMYGTGFPKSTDVSKELDKRAGAKREVIGPSARHNSYSTGSGATIGHGTGVPMLTAPATDAAKQWSGYGTALKPAWEPVILARKPLDGTIAANVIKWGCGALAIDPCRIGDEERYNGPTGKRGEADVGAFGIKAGEGSHVTGRFPANVILDEDAGAHLDDVVGDRPSTLTNRKQRYAWCAHCKAPEVRDEETWPIGSDVKCGACGERYEIEIVTHDAPASAVPNPSKVRGQRTVLAGQGGGGVVYGDSGGPSRFFYSAKVSTKERNAGLDAFPVLSGGEATDREEGSDGLESPRAGAGRGGGSRNGHPTLKPIALTEYLARLLLPPGLDTSLLVPFAGTGSEMIGALKAGWPRVVGIELSPEYVAIGNARIAHHTTNPKDAK